MSLLHILFLLHKFPDVAFSDCSEIPFDTGYVTDTNDSNNCRWFRKHSRVTRGIRSGQLHRMGQADVPLLDEDAAQRRELPRHLLEHFFQEILLLATLHVLSAL